MSLLKYLQWNTKDDTKYKKKYENPYGEHFFNVLI